MVIAAVASAVAAVFSWRIAANAGSVPYKAAIYSERLQAISDYARASARFQSALSDANRDVPAIVDTPEDLAAASDEMMYNSAIAARPILAAWDDYIAETSGIQAPFSLKVHKAMSAAENAGQLAKGCYQTLGWRVDHVQNKPGWWDMIREKAKKPCLNIHDPKKHRAAAEFDRRARLVLRVMTDELRQDGEQFVPGVAHEPLD